MNRRQHDFQRATREHHRESARAGALGEKLGMSWIIEASQLPAFLSDWCRDDCIDELFLRRFYCIDTKSHRSFASHFAGAADGAAKHRVLIVIDDNHVMRIRSQPAVALIAPPEYIVFRQVCCIRKQLIHPINDVAGALPQHRVGQRFDDDLRPNSGRVTHGNCDGGAVIHFRSPNNRSQTRNGNRTIGVP